MSYKDKGEQRAADLRYRATDKGKWMRAREQAAKRNLAWDISTEDFAWLTRLPCYYCATTDPMKYGHGLDRVDNALGYSIENVVPSCGPCNYIRGQYLSVGEMREAMRAVKLYRLQQPNLLGEKDKAA